MRNIFKCLALGTFFSELFHFCVYLLVKVINPEWKPPNRQYTLILHLCMADKFRWLNQCFRCRTRPVMELECITYLVSRSRISKMAAAKQEIHACLLVRMIAELFQRLDIRYIWDGQVNEAHMKHVPCKRK